jgi:hypothetical protein
MLFLFKITKNYYCFFRFSKYFFTTWTILNETIFFFYNSIYIWIFIINISSIKINIYTGIVSDQTLGDCIQELIDGAYDIYSSILRLPYNTTIICGGQSPSYYCLAMMNFSIYNSEVANIIILPHSKAGVESNNQLEENRKYCARLKEKGIKLNNNVIIIDGVHSGVGILALENALIHCYPGINVQKYAINYGPGISRIPVNKEYYFRCEPKFSDTFPRLITSYYPRDFDDASKFRNEFILDDNPIAEMIIDIAKNYPDIKVEDTEWFKVNNEITSEIVILKQKERERLERERERLERERERERLERERLERSAGQTFVPIIKTDNYGNKIYECPACHRRSGSLLIITHNFDCKNNGKDPKE